MKRSPLKRGSSILQRTKGLNRRSAKADAYLVELDAAKEQVRQRSGGICEALIAEVCQTRAAHVHHRKPRSKGGSNALSNLLHTCRACHEHIHAHPLTSRERGFILRQEADENT